MHNRTISLFALLVAVTITLYFLLMYKTQLKFSTGPFPMDWTIDLPQDDTSFGGLFFRPYINDSLPHYIYKKKEDSLKKIIEARELDNKSHTLRGRTIGPVGVHTVKKTWSASFNNIIDNRRDSLSKQILDSMDKIYEKITFLNNTDSINILKKKAEDIFYRYQLRQHELHQKSVKNEQAEELHYFGLNGYHLDYDTRFFIQNGTYNLAYVKWDSIVKRTYDSTQVGHYEQKQIPVRYSTGDKRVLIPISEKRYNFLYTFLNILSFSFLFIFVYFFIGLPIQILFDISKGKAFIKQNINRFNTMALVLFGFAFIKTFTPYILGFLNRKKIPPEFELPGLFQTVYSNLYLFFISMALFIIGKAFQRGYRLQLDQDLTV